jgi:type I restriction enzyme S subunit
MATLERVQSNLERYLASVLQAAVEGRLVPTEAELARAEGRLVPTEAELARVEGRTYETGAVLLERVILERRRCFEATGAEEGQKGKTGTGRTKYEEARTPDVSRLPDLPEGWTWASTDQLFWFVTSGPRGWAKYHSASGAAFLRVGNLDHDSIYLDLSHVQYVRPPAGSEGTRTRVLPGDLLISITADVGMVALAADQIEEAYINQHVALARPVDGFNRRYLAWFLAASEGGQKQFLSLQRGATKVGLGLQDIRSVNVPLPPLAEQERIVRAIERYLSLASNCESARSVSAARCERLRQAILRWGFEGRLVDQDPTDEPASVLLERIRAERARVNNGETTRRNRRAGRKATTAQISMTDLEAPV